MNHNHHIHKRKYEKNDMEPEEWKAVSERSSSTSSLTDSTVNHKSDPVPLLKYKNENPAD